MFCVCVRDNQFSKCLDPWCHHQATWVSQSTFPQIGKKKQMMNCGGLLKETPPFNHPSASSMWTFQTGSWISHRRNQSADGGHRLALGGQFMVCLDNTFSLYVFTYVYIYEGTFCKCKSPPPPVKDGSHRILQCSPSPSPPPVKEVPQIHHTHINVYKYIYIYIFIYMQIHVA